MIRLSELRTKEIITVHDGKRLGHLSDLEIDPEHGNIQAIIIYLREGNTLFGKQEELVIYWNQIMTIGDDVILVEERRESNLFLQEPV